MLLHEIGSGLYDYGFKVEYDRLQMEPVELYSSFLSVYSLLAEGAYCTEMCVAMAQASVDTTERWSPLALVNEANVRWRGLSAFGLETDESPQLLTAQRFGAMSAADAVEILVQAEALAVAVPLLNRGCTPNEAFQYAEQIVEPCMAIFASGQGVDAVRGYLRSVAQSLEPR